jgi:glutamyl-tRNA synthetase
LPKSAGEGMVKGVIPLVKDRIKTLKEFASIAGFFFEEPKVDRKLLGKNYQEHLLKAREAIQSVEVWNKDSVDETLMGVVNKNGFKTGDFFMDLRIAITGSKFTPPINDSIVILGKAETLRRLEKI